jgi:hypothetical protein
MTKLGVFKHELYSFHQLTHEDISDSRYGVEIWLELNILE